MGKTERVVAREALARPMGLERGRRPVRALTNSAFALGSSERTGRGYNIAELLAPRSTAGGGGKRPGKKKQPPPPTSSAVTGLRVGGINEPSSSEGREGENRSRGGTCRRLIILQPEGGEGSRL